MRSVDWFDKRKNEEKKHMTILENNNDEEEDKLIQTDTMILTRSFKRNSELFVITL